MARITFHSNGVLQVPSNPTIPYIEGDGVGPKKNRRDVKEDATVRIAAFHIADQGGHPRGA